jgi:putative ABC transport system substrate-binding protein
MKRRELISLLASGALWPLAARAQRPKRIARIGFLGIGSREAPTARAFRSAFHEGLREHGYVDGQNVLVEVRTADWEVERLRALASELVGLNPDVIVAPNSLAGRALQQATTTIPIVIPVMGDPVADGLVASLARPGGNITGLTFLGPQLVPKRLALLKEALPTFSKVAGLLHAGAYSEHTMSDMLNEAQAAAQTLDLQLRVIDVRGPDELDQAFSVMGNERVDALMVFPSPMLFIERKRIVDLAAKLRLPLASISKEFVQLGGLMSYGADIIDLSRRSAAYVDKILNGAKPADLPVEQPTKFELFINLKNAKVLGLTLPPSLLAQADEVIE